MWGGERVVEETYVSGDPKRRVIHYLHKGRLAKAR